MQKEKEQTFSDKEKSPSLCQLRHKPSVESSSLELYRGAEAETMIYHRKGRGQRGGNVNMSGIAVSSSGS